MVYSAKAKTLSAVWGTLLLLLCGSGCYVSANHWGLSICGTGCLFPFQGRAQRCGHACAGGSECYGYNATCWRPWPEHCPGCPVDLTHPAGTETSIAVEEEANATSSIPTPAGGPAGGPSPLPDATDWDLLAPPSSDPLDRNGNAEAAPPSGDEPQESKSPPVRGDGPRSSDDDLAPLPETERPGPLKMEAPPPEPPGEENTQVQAGPSTLKFVSFYVSKVPTACKPKTTSGAAGGNARGSLPRTPRERERQHRGAGAYRGAESASGDGRESAIILEALRTSFSPPAVTVRLRLPN